MPFTFDAFDFDECSYELRRHGELVEADAKVLDLLVYFLRHPHTLIAKETLLDEVWDGRAVSENSLSVAVAKLRKALRHGDTNVEAKFVTTIYGRGYRFERRVEAHTTSKGAPASLGEAGDVDPRVVPAEGRRPGLALPGAAVRRVLESALTLRQDERVALAVELLATLHGDPPRPPAPRPNTVP